MTILIEQPPFGMLTFYALLCCKDVHFNHGLQKRYRNGRFRTGTRLALTKFHAVTVVVVERRYGGGNRLFNGISERIGKIGTDRPMLSYFFSLYDAAFCVYVLSVYMYARRRGRENCVSLICAKHEFDIAEKKVPYDDANELVLDGGFVMPKLESDGKFDAPEINSFGNSFRDYNAQSERQESVEEFYRLNHINQTVEFVKKMREEYRKLDKLEMSIWECCELLNDVVDDSDPDLDEPQIEHLLQTAEAIRKDYPNDHWLHLTALIHDLGKVLLLPTFGALPQWAVVGDTFPLGCAFDESIVHHKYFKTNTDAQNPSYSTRNGIYQEGCGLDNVLMSFGHDDYMYLVAKENGTTLPSAALFVIRYHSFYPLHRAGAYAHLMNEEDKENLKWLHIFNKYDLYSKSKVRVDVEKVKPYYLSLIEKYFPAKLRW